MFIRRSAILFCSRYAVLAILLCVLFSCDLPTNLPGDTGSGGVTGDDVQEDTNDLFTPDPDNPGELVLNTNNPVYIKPDGCTLWTVSGDHETDFTSYEVGVTKHTGFKDGGFGIVFCAQNTGAEYGSCLLAVLITTTRQYTIGKVVNGEYRNIQWWKISEKLFAGYNRENILKVTYDKASETYSLFLNGTKECEFKDMIQPQLQGGKQGVAAVITKNEGFPLFRVDIRYRPITN